MKAIKKHIITIHTLGFFFFIGIIPACKKGDWYDVKSNKSLAVPTALKDMQALMDNTSVMNTFTPGMGEVASDGHYINDPILLFRYEQSAYTWSKKENYREVADWAQITNGSYIRIYYANLVLDGMPKIKPIGGTEQEQWNNIKGQALFHRTHAFYELAQVFAPPFEVSNANSKLGIPLRLEADINIPSKRGTVQQTYDQIINDLTLAKDLLPESPLYKTRPSKYAIYALLARCYLSMANYEQAAIYSNLCLNSYDVLMDYKTLNTSTTDNPFINYSPEIIFYSYMGYYASIDQYSPVFIEKNLYNSYSENDLRKKVFYNFDNSSNLVSYKGTYSTNGYGNAFSGLATDEIYLIRAECFARAGKVTEAMTDLNTLLRTRWDPNATNPAKAYVDITASDKDDALREVLEERKKELILRGTRWSDLRRLNRDPRFAVTLTRTIGGKTYTLEPNSYKYTFPIPDDIIEMTGMEQNPGW